MPIYNFRPPVPLEELWFVAVGGPYYQIDGPSLHVGISKRTGEVLWANWVTEGG